MSQTGQVLYSVAIQTRCKACAMAIAGQVPKLGTIRSAFVTQPQTDGEVDLTIHANSAWIQAHDGSPIACPEHGAVLDLSREP